MFRDTIFSQNHFHKDEQEIKGNSLRCFEIDLKLF